MKVQIISKEIIRPSVPTPPNLRTYKLCVLDQLSVQCYIPMVIFYTPQSCEKSRETTDILKQSLSEALNNFYPLAGRIKNNLSCVDCNDDGVTFVEAKVSVDFSASLEQQNTVGLQMFLPCKPDDRASDLTKQVLLAIQVNHFECGGIAIGVTMWHGIGDASSLTSFLKVWGAIARGSAIDHKSNKIISNDIVVDCTSLFPPLSHYHPYANVGATYMKGKKFVINGQKLASLKQEIGPGTTTFEAVASLLWAAVMTTIEDDNLLDLMLLINLRKRLEPPLPEHRLGNIVHAPIVEWPHSPNKNVADYKGLTQAIQATKRMMTNDYIRRCHDVEGGYLSFLRDIYKERCRLGTSKLFVISSLCGFSFYDVDFGWGKPIWVCRASSPDLTCFLMNTRDGDEIEAWVGLSEEGMEKFLQYPGIIAYTSFSPNMLQENSI